MVNILFKKKVYSQYSLSILTEDFFAQEERRNAGSIAGYEEEGRCLRNPCIYLSLISQCRIDDKSELHPIHDIYSARKLYCSDNWILIYNMVNFALERQSVCVSRSASKTWWMYFAQGVFFLTAPPP